MSLIKIKVQYKDSNKVVNLDRSKPNLYDRLMMQLAMSIEEDIMLFDGPMILSGETALAAAIEDCVRTHQPFLQLTARENKMKKQMSLINLHAAAGQKLATQPAAQPKQEPKKEEPKPVVQASGDACVECGKPVGGKRFCTNCGAQAPVIPVKKEEPKPEPKKEEPKVQGPVCVECKNPLNGAKFCTNCGAKAPEPKKEEPKPEPKKEEPKVDKCPACSFEWGVAKFCTNCGHK